MANKNTNEGSRTLATQSAAPLAAQRLYHALLEARGPLSAPALAESANLALEEASLALESLVLERRAVAGRLVVGSGERLYRWATHWARGIEIRTAAARERLAARTAAAEEWTTGAPDPLGRAAAEFVDFVCTDYQPPEDKRILVILQCSVRRPFSSSPSHSSMRRAISLATGLDPHHGFSLCPVHVVVCASRIGPVPYEFENVHPASVPGGGVKHFRPDEYARVRPILAERLARYLAQHRGAYDHIASFTEGRYAEVVSDAAVLASAYVAILPMVSGAQVLRRGRSRPRKYWEHYWIQLYLAVVGWLGRDEQTAAAERLRADDVEYAGASCPSECHW